MSTTPKIPLGPYPHAALCGQEGSAPTNIKINRIIKIVLSIRSPLLRFAFLLDS
jgi:hypothetical protein